MFTLDDAAKAGWTLVAEGEDGRAWTGDAEKPDDLIQVTNSTPLFGLLVNISERIGQPFAAGYGGAEPITAELVLACSGETYDPGPAPAPSAPPPPPAANAVLKALAGLDETTATVADVVRAVKLALQDAGATTEPPESAAT